MDKLHLSAEAKADLAKIKTYIAAELENPVAATHTVAKITKNIRILRRHPYAGAPLVSVADVREKDYRFLVSGNYLVFYRVQGEDVYVDRVLYGKRDYLRALFEET